MIFNNNSTSLGELDVPMAEGYDCSTGIATALIESAKNDYKMFTAMLEVEAREIQINNSTDGYVNEAEIVALKEASIKGIWEKIKELFRKLIAKIKAILHSFYVKVSALFMKDKELIKKYRREVLTKDNIENLEVKWSKSYKKRIDEIKPFAHTNSMDDFTVDEMKKIDTKDKKDFEIFNQFKQNMFKDEDEWNNPLKDIEAPEKTAIKNIDGGIQGIISYLEEYDKKISDIKTYENNSVKKIAKLVDDCDKNVDTAVEEHGESQELNEATNAYKAASVIQAGILKMLEVQKTLYLNNYKQCKAAFVKAAAVNSKKLEETAIYAEALAEAAEDEVDDVISNAVDSNDGDVESVSNADTTVLPSSDDNDEAKKKCDNSYVKSESAYFSELLF